jgi:hypothetical protein
MVTRFCHCMIGTMFVRPARCESLPFKAKHLWETSETWQRLLLHRRAMRLTANASLASGNALLRDKVCSGQELR